MEILFCENLVELKKKRKFLEKKLNVKLNIKGKQITIEGSSLDEYEASLVIDAISLGFPATTALLLKEDDMVFEKFQIRDFTKRKSLKVIRGRIIGTHGKTKKTIEQIADCKIKIKRNTIGIIGPAESIEYARTGITNIIHGSKQTNVYKYLERINRQKNTPKKIKKHLF